MKSKKILVRSGLIIVSMMLICISMMVLIAQKDLFYSNWWGGLVFAPITLLIGISLLGIVIYKWKDIDKF